jgi:hypothetical protein
MGDELRDYLRSRAPGPFKPAAHYSHNGDMLEVYFEDVPAYSENLTPDIVLIRADDDRRVVGVKVFGVANLVWGEDTHHG